MRAFETDHAEPRYSIESPVYRVNFWQRSREAWNLDAFVLVGGDGITEVLTWAEEHAGERRYEIFVEMDEEPMAPLEIPRTAGLVRLLGSNPNAGETVEIGRFERE